MKIIISGETEVTVQTGCNFIVKGETIETSAVISLKLK